MAAIFVTACLIHPAHSRLLGQETTIKVDVRQVLVPVIVTDKAGHHATALTPADFKVFEDGVEQEISGFAVESSGIAGADLAEIAEPSSGMKPRRPKVTPAARRLYLVCIDTLHSSFADLLTSS